MHSTTPWHYSLAFESPFSDCQRAPLECRFLISVIAAEDFNCQTSLPLSPLSFSLSLLQSFQFLADYISVSLGKFCFAAVIIQNVNVISQFFIIFFLYSDIGFSVFSLVFGWSLNSQLWQLLIVCLQSATESSFMPPRTCWQFPNRGIRDW